MTLRLSENVSWLRTNDRANGLQAKNESFLCNVQILFVAAALPLFEVLLGFSPNIKKIKSIVKPAIFQSPDIMSEHFLKESFYRFYYDNSSQSGAQCKGGSGSQESYKPQNSSLIWKCALDFNTLTVAPPVWRSFSIFHSIYHDPEYLVLCVLFLEQKNTVLRSIPWPTERHCILVEMKPEILSAKPSPWYPSKMLSCSEVLNFPDPGLGKQLVVV